MRKKKKLGCANAVVFSVAYDDVLGEGSWSIGRHLSTMMLWEKDVMPSLFLKSKKINPPKHATIYGHWEIKITVEINWRINAISDADFHSFPEW